RGQEPGRTGQFHCPTARGVNVEAEIAEERQNLSARVSLPRIAQREPVRRPQRQQAPRRSLQCDAVVDVAGGAESRAYLGCLLSREKRHQSFSSASRLRLRIWSFSSRLSDASPCTHATGEGCHGTNGQSLPSTTRSAPTSSSRNRSGVSPPTTVSCDTRRRALRGRTG